MKIRTKSFTYQFKKKVQILKQMNIEIPGDIYYRMSIGTVHDLDRIAKQLIKDKEYI